MNLYFPVISWCDKEACSFIPATMSVSDATTHYLVSFKVMSNFLRIPGVGEEQSMLYVHKLRLPRVVLRDPC